jgi:hypothetical protein
VDFINIIGDTLNIGNVGFCRDELRMGAIILVVGLMESSIYLRIGINKVFIGPSTGWEFNLLSA